MSLRDDVCEILISEEELKEICKRLGEQISKDYEGKKLLLISVLKGAVVFMSDLLKEITCDCIIDFMYNFIICVYHFIPHLPCGI